MKNLCPFCKQDLQSSDIIACYEAYFSDNYTKLKETIKDYRKSLSADHSEEVQLAFEDAIQEVKQKIKFWREFVDIPEIKIETTEIARSWKNARDLILKALEEKLASPLELIPLSDKTITAIEGYKIYQIDIDKTLLKLESYNTQIKALKEKIDTANIATLTDKLANFKAIKERHNPNVVPLCDAYLQEKNGGITRGG